VSTDQRPDMQRELARLKDFQRQTVDYVHRRLWLDSDATKRFLVADEVGLGKTLVARGVIAKTIDYLWDSIDRIDIVYICSNTQIARQNLSRLNIGGHNIDHADRLTLLPTVITDLRENKVNYVSFTPGTSFHVTESGGRSAERVLLYWLLAAAWGRSAVASRPWLRFFEGGSTSESFQQELRAFDRASIDDELATKFADDVANATFDEGQSLENALDETVARFRYLRGQPEPQLSRRRYRLIGRLRSLIAHAAVHALEPDLVILDEFQRFKDLLAPGGLGADLAHAIFDAQTARVLLLSATPYKMYTLPDEPEGDDHYADFIKTLEFLNQDGSAQTVAAHLRTIRDVLLTGGDRAVAQHARRTVEARLRKVMARTERLAATPDRDGMLEPREMTGLELTPNDVRAYRSAHAVAWLVDRRQDVFEYWRSAPYLLNIMESYKVKARLKDAIGRGDPDFVAALERAEGLLNWNDMRRYRAIDPANAKLRALSRDVLDRGAWQLAWIPPSLPYLTPGGAYADPALSRFTKRLIFSAWAVVPKAISILISYEAERRAMQAAGTQRRYDARRARGLLRFQFFDGRLTGMPVLAILYPCVSLAIAGDPLVNARRTADALPADRSKVEEQIHDELETLLGQLPTGPLEGPVDQRWYWAVPFLLDQRLLGDAHDRFLDQMASWYDTDDDDAQHQQSQLARHVREAKTVDARSLGRRPEDLVQVVTRLALAAPGTCALRALTRVCGGDDALSDETIRVHASDISWGLRALFNRPEIMSVLRAADEGADSYWTAVLDHCVEGNLQATLDEYLHVLVESEGLQDKVGAARAAQLAAVAAEALTIRSVPFTVDDIRVTRGEARLQTQRARVHLAARFGRDPTEEKSVQREGQLRIAFNSPFWPFVLSSTSVGQEGLDFHVYCHAVVHWNLPGNPVDLEQREGRVHRYKGHAIRRNIAAKFADAALRSSEDDPWSTMFRAAHDARSPDKNDLVPYWVFAPDGGVKIERYVPAMPLSREQARYHRLLRTVGAYRLVIGQPRQDDLLRYCTQSPEDIDWLRIDLSPSVSGNEATTS
jgi:Helicase conserved C-terminal domain